MLIPEGKTIAAKSHSRCHMEPVKRLGWPVCHELGGLSPSSILTSSQEIRPARYHHVILLQKIDSNRKSDLIGMWSLGHLPLLVELGVTVISDGVRMSSACF